jgi:hypothetical protein
VTNPHGVAYRLDKVSWADERIFIGEFPTEVDAARAGGVIDAMSGWHPQITRVTPVVAGDQETE